MRSSLQEFLFGWNPKCGSSSATDIITNKFQAGEPGFEPGLTVPKTAVLPLHHSPTQPHLQAGEFYHRLSKTGNPYPYEG
jgi:hypothetical protein